MPHRLQTSDLFVTLLYPGENGAGSLPSPRIPVLFWSHGHSVWQVNAYLLYLRKQGRAVSTVRTYGAELWLLVLYLDGLNLRFDSIHDEDLFAFGAWLRGRNAAGRSQSACTQRHANRVIGRCISFFLWLQTRVPCARPLVGGEGTDCNIAVRQRSGTRRGHKYVHFHHPAMGPPEVRKKVKPISRGSIEAIMEASSNRSKRPFTRARNQALLSLLADSGVRREEITWIKVADIQKAVVDGGMLPVRTSKRDGNPIRVVPVPLVTVEVVETFLEMERAIQIRAAVRQKKIRSDPGWAFCTSLGKRLAPTTISQLFGDLRKAAGLSGRAHAHMLRHRWITLQVVRRLQALQQEGRIGLEVSTTMLSRVASISGHSSLDSLWVYVDWAFEELGVWAKADRYELSKAEKDEVFRLLDLLASGDGASIVRSIKAKLEAAVGIERSAGRAVTLHSARKNRGER